MRARLLDPERLRMAFAQRLVKLPAALVERLVGSPERDGEHTLDPHLQLILRVQKLSGEGGFDQKPSLAESRRSYHVLVDTLERPEPPSAQETERTLTHDGLSVRVRVHHPAPGQRRPALVYFHGGGFVVGDLESHASFLRRMAREADVVVVAVDYRLAPEHPFPAAVDDCIAATRAVLAKAAELGVDPARVAVGGDSAGANLALNVTQVVPEVRGQLVLYPTTDVDLDTPSKRRFATGFGLDRTTVDWFTERYLGRSNHADPRASPLRSTTLDRCPRTIVVLAGFDVLRDEGHRLIERLESAGVRTTSRVESAMIHGFIHLTRIVSCDAATARLARDVRDLLHA
jgi:acetyl esterase